jgi:hypothetical protein
MITDQEIETALRRLAARSEALHPSPEQCEAIRQRRARGDRVTFCIEVTRGSRAVGWGIGGSALLAACLAMAVLASLRQRSNSGNERAPSLLPGALMAKSSGQPAFPALEHLSGQRLRPGRWIYAAEPLSDSSSRDTLVVYELRPVSFRNSEAWLVLAGMQIHGAATVYSDSTWLSRGRLDVLAHWRDTLVAWQPLATNLQTILLATTLDSAWKASLPLLGTPQGSRDGQGWLNLKVYGREFTESPAGRCGCWKVGFRPSLGFFFWVNADGWMMRQGMSEADDLRFGKMNLVLVRFEEP